VRVRVRLKGFFWLPKSHQHGRAEVSSCLTFTNPSDRVPSRTGIQSDWIRSRTGTQSDWTGASLLAIQNISVIDQINFSNDFSTLTALMI
jgi:hypothetical protein